MPLLGGLLVAIIRHPAASWPIAMAATAASLACALSLAREVAANGVISYALGGFPPELGIEYRSMPSTSSFSSSSPSWHWRRSPSPPQRGVRDRRRAPALVLHDDARRHVRPARHGGHRRRLQRFCFPRDFVARHLHADRARPRSPRARRRLPVSHRRNSSARPSMSSASGFSISRRARSPRADRRAPAGGRLAARASRRGGLHPRRHRPQAGALPLHAWLPTPMAMPPRRDGPARVHGDQGRGLPAGPLHLRIFGLHREFGDISGASLLVLLSLAAMFLASAAAIFQNDVKRLLLSRRSGRSATSRSASPSPIPMRSPAAFLHIANHAVMKGAAFMAIGAILYRCGSERLEDLAGIAAACRSPALC